MLGEKIDHFFLLLLIWEEFVGRKNDWFEGKKYNTDKSFKSC